jgi:hypothetical protein
VGADSKHGPPSSAQTRAHKIATLAGLQHLAAAYASPKKMVGCNFKPAGQGWSKKGWRRSEANRRPKPVNAGEIAAAAHLKDAARLRFYDGR